MHARFHVLTRRALLTLLLISPGCRSPTPIERVCQQARECIEENAADYDYNECVSRFERMTDLYAEIGCAEQHESFLECFADNADCKQGKFALETEGCAMGLLPDCEERQACSSEASTLHACYTRPE